MESICCGELGFRHMGGDDTGGWTCSPQEGPWVSGIFMASNFRLPSLVEGKVYRHEDVLDYICKDDEGHSDYGLAAIHFPRDLTEKFEFDPLNYRPDEPILLQFQIFPLVIFANQLKSFQKRFAELDSLRDQG